MQFYDRIFFLVIWASFLILPSYADDRFTVQNIHVDVTDSSATEARLRAIAQGQREAFKILMERILTPEDVASLPDVTDAQLDTFLQDFEVQNEKNSAVRYIGTLTLRFNPSRVQDFLAHRNKSLLPAEKNATIVVIPVYEEGHGSQLWEEKNPWREAWNEYAGLDPRYVLPMGDLDDRSELSLQHVLKGEKKNIARLMQRYHAGQILIAVLKHDFPFILSVYIYNQEGLSHMEESIPLLGEETLTPAMTRKAIEKTLEIGKKLDAEDNNSLIAAHTIDYRILFDNHKEWLDIQDKLSRLRAIRRVDIASLKLRQALGALEYVGQQEAMENALKAEGFDISPDPQMPQRRLIKGYKMLKNEKNSSAPDTVLSPLEEGME